MDDQYGAWKDPEEISEGFLFYADVLFQAFGDRVKNWVTINEVRGLLQSRRRLIRWLMKTVAHCRYFLREFGPLQGLVAFGRQLEVSVGLASSSCGVSNWLMDYILLSYPDQQMH